MVKEPPMEVSGGRTVQKEETTSEKALKGVVLGRFKKPHRGQMNQFKKITRLEDKTICGVRLWMNSVEGGRLGRRLEQESKEERMVARTRVTAVEW